MKKITKKLVYNSTLLALCIVHIGPLIAAVANPNIPPAPPLPPAQPQQQLDFQVLPPVLVQFLDVVIQDLRLSQMLPFAVEIGRFLQTQACSHYVITQDPATQQITAITFYPQPFPLVPGRRTFTITVDQLQALNQAMNNWITQQNQAAANRNAPVQQQGQVPAPQAQQPIAQPVAQPVAQPAIPPVATPDTTKSMGRNNQADQKSDPALEKKDGKRTPRRGGDGGSSSKPTASPTPPMPGQGPAGNHPMHYPFPHYPMPHQTFNPQHHKPPVPAHDKIGYGIANPGGITRSADATAADIQSMQPRGAIHIALPSVGIEESGIEVPSITPLRYTFHHARRTERRTPTVEPLEKKAEKKEITMISKEPLKKSESSWLYTTYTKISDVITQWITSFMSWFN